MRKILVAVFFTLIPLTGITGTHALPRPHAVVATLFPVGGSDVSGFVRLKQLPGGGTQISVRARHLMPGHTYRSLYYGNATCQIEPYSASDVIGGDYVANRGGHGRTRGQVDDDLDEINSVSVRDGSQPFSPSNPGILLACAKITHY
jgi:hypothetical protein